jgi:UTP--glucose-1-phosphate uridylyltransferase
VIRKAVIPAAGLGMRFLPITKAQPKEMLPVVRKPVIQYVVEEAYQSGIRDVLIITGRHKRSVEDHLDKAGVAGVEDESTRELDRMLEDMNILFVRQREPKGLGDAVRYAEPYVGGEPFALLLGDNITTPPCLEQLMDAYERFKATIIALEKVPAERVRHHGVVEGVEVEENVLQLRRLVEKPELGEAPSNLAIIGRYILTPDVFEHLKAIIPGYKGELQLTDALAKMVSNGRHGVYGVLYEGKRYDVGDIGGWLKANIELALRDEEFREEVVKLFHSVKEFDKP